MPEKPEEESLMQRIIYSSLLGKRCLDGVLRRNGYNVTPVQSQLLLFLARQQSELTQREAEEALRLRPSTVNGVVERLEEKGYIARRPSPRDGRFRLLRLTDAGKARIEMFRDVAEGVERRAFRGFAEEEQALLDKLLSRIIENLENEVHSS